MSLIISAKFNSKCAETGKTIKKHDPIYYDRVTKKAYCEHSQRYKDIKLFQDTAKIVEDDFIQDPGEQYFDNFCQNNGI